MDPPIKRAKPTSSRRMPYAAAACDACHGRKLKCSGERPCARCKKQGISCSYPSKALPTTAGFNPSLSHPQPGHQLENRSSSMLFASIDDLQRQLDHFRSILHDATVSNPAIAMLPNSSAVPQQIDEFDNHSRNQSALWRKGSGSAGPLDAYAGPTSFAWGMLTADARLSNLTPSKSGLAHSRSPSPQSIEDNQLPYASSQADPSDIQQEISLEKFTVEDILRCLDTFQDVFGILHRIPQLDQIRANAPSILRSAKRSVRLCIHNMSRPWGSVLCLITLFADPHILLQRFISCLGMPVNFLIVLQIWSQPVAPGTCSLLEMTKIILATALVAQTGTRTRLVCSDNAGRDENLQVDSQTSCTNPLSPASPHVLSNILSASTSAHCYYLWYAHRLSMETATETRLRQYTILPTKTWFLARGASCLPRVPLSKKVCIVLKGSQPSVQMKKSDNQSFASCGACSCLTINSISQRVCPSTYKMTMLTFPVRLTHPT
jgi:hypothetical protein